jgi:hypothetical protein
LTKEHQEYLKENIVDALKECVEDAFKFKADPQYRPQGMNPFIEINKTCIYLMNHISNAELRRNHAIKIYCCFNTFESTPKDVAEFVLFGLDTIQSFEAVDGKTFKINHVDYVDDPLGMLGTAHLAITVIEIIDEGEHK